MDYATVRLGEYEVPLIGIPRTATEEKCSKCGLTFHLADVSMDENMNPVCKSCQYTGTAPRDAASSIISKSSSRL